MLSAAGSFLAIGTATGQWTDAPVIAYGIVAASTLGFLPYNFPKASMFMGDVGSAPLGLLLAGLLWWSFVMYGWEVGVLLVLLQTNFILDTGITLAIRILNGEKWYEAHRKHFYQKLIRSGLSHVLVTLLEMGGLAMVIAGVWGVARTSDFSGIWVLSGTVVLLWVSLFWWANRRFERSSAT